MIHDTSTRDSAPDHEFEEEELSSSTGYLSLGALMPPAAPTDSDSEIWGSPWSFGALD